MKSFKKFVESRDRNLNEMARFYAADVDKADMQEFDNTLRKVFRQIDDVKNFINQVVDTENKTILNMTPAEYTLHKGDFNRSCNRDNIHFWKDKSSISGSGNLTTISVSDVLHALDGNRRANKLGTDGVTTLSTVLECLEKIKGFYTELSHKPERAYSKNVPSFGSTGKLGEGGAIREIANDAQAVEKSLDDLVNKLELFSVIVI